MVLGEAFGLAQRWIPEPALLRIDTRREPEFLPVPACASFKFAVDSVGWSRAGVGGGGRCRWRRHWCRRGGGRGCAGRVVPRKPRIERSHLERHLHPHSPAHG